MSSKKKRQVNAHAGGVVPTQTKGRNGEWYLKRGFTGAIVILLVALLCVRHATVGWKALARELTAHGAVLRIQLGVNTNGTRGVYPDAPIAKGGLLISIPDEYTFPVTGAAENTLAFAQAFRGERFSKWRPLLPTLDEFQKDFIFHEPFDDIISELMPHFGVDLQNSIQQYRRVRSKFATGEQLRAINVHLSRAWKIGNSQGFIAPGFDMVNHGTPNVKIEFSEGAKQLIALTDLAVTDELLMSYGESLQAEDFLFRFGFVPEDAETKPWDKEVCDKLIKIIVPRIEHVKHFWHVRTLLAMKCEKIGKQDL